MTEQPITRDKNLGGEPNGKISKVSARFLASAKLILVVLACIGATILALPLAAIVEAENLVTHKKGGPFGRLLDELVKQ